MQGLEQAIRTLVGAASGPTMAAAAAATAAAHHTSNGNGAGGPFHRHVPRGAELSSRYGSVPDLSSLGGSSASYFSRLESLASSAVKAADKVRLLNAMAAPLFVVVAAVVIVVVVLGGGGRIVLLLLLLLSPPLLPLSSSVVLNS